MKDKLVFTSSSNDKVLLSSQLRDALSTHDTNIVQQRIFISILNAIKEKQSLFINTKQNYSQEVENNTKYTVDQYFEYMAQDGLVHFQLDIKSVNQGRLMRNEIIHTVLEDLSTIKSFQLKDNSINGYKVVFFILDPKWNKEFIFFSMNCEVIKFLFRLSPYYSLRANLPYVSSSPNTLRFLLWIMPYKKMKLVEKSFTDLLKALRIPKDRYRYPSIFERDFLIPVKADLDNHNDLSIDYILENKNFKFTLMNPQNMVKLIGFNNKNKTLEEIKIDRALKYLEKRRSLNSDQLIRMRRLYLSKGYDSLTVMIRRKIDVKLSGKDYVDAVFDLK